MPPRKKPRQTGPLRRSERLRVRRETAEAAEVARISVLEQQDQKLLAELPSLRMGGRGRAPSRGRVTRRATTPRPNAAVTSTSTSEPPRRATTPRPNVAVTPTSNSEPPRRGRTQPQNMPVTSTPFCEQRPGFFGQFMDGILHAAQEFYTGGLSEGPTPALNRDEQPTQNQRESVAGEELQAEGRSITEDLHIFITLSSSDSDSEY